MIKEKPVGICPSCFQAVFNSKETEGPVWTCPSDLKSDNPYYLPSEVTEERKEQYYGNCPSEHSLDHGYCQHYNHLPLHSACYDKGDF